MTALGTTNIFFATSILAISHKDTEVIKALQVVFKPKGEMIVAPDMYLGARLLVMDDDSQKHGA